MIRNWEEVESFLLVYPNAKVVIASTVRDGFVSCIKPVPTMFGAELMCNKDTRQELSEAMAHPQ